MSHGVFISRKQRSVIMSFLIIAVLIGFCLTGCAAPVAEEEEPTTLHVSAAASLTDALTEIGEGYSAEVPVTIEFNFGGSGALKTQIIEGAPCDLFISASANHMNDLVQDGMILSQSQVELLKNTLTLIASEEKSGEVSVATLNTDGVESVSIGEPETVPAGQYAKEALTSLNLWEALEGKLIYAKDVRAVLEYVESGNVDCGIVYRTDAVLLETGVIIEDFPADSHKPIVYPAALLAESGNLEVGQEFLDYLQGPEAKAIFEKYGFTVI